MTRQYATYTVLSASVVVLAAAARLVDPALFERFTGGTEPVLAAALIGVLGAAALHFLEAGGGFVIVRSEPLPGLRRAVGFAVLFGLLIIGVDVALPHPADMNVPLPASLLFYPVISLMAEVLFHLLPLAALLTVMRAFQPPSESAMRASLVLVALVEPSFQAWAVLNDTPLVGAPHPHDTRILAYDWVHVAAINLCQLLLFKRYDFVSMWTFRLAYYAVWHIVWADLRLRMVL